MKFYNLFEGIYWSISQKRGGKTKNQKKISKISDFFFEKTIDRRGMHEYDIMWLAKANYFKSAQLA